VLQAPSPLPAILIAGWAIGFIGIGCSAWFRWRRISAAVRAGSPVLQGLPIRAISSPSFLEPGVFGVLRPILLLPDGIFDQLTPEQWKSVVDHELCHIRHGDNLIGLLQMFVESVFWFHPVVWWIGKRILQEREIACDEEVLKLGSEPRAYAQGILKVCELYLESPVACVSGVSGSNLRKRIEAILSNRGTHKLSYGKRLLVTGAAALALVVPIAAGAMNASSVAAQRSRRPIFEAFEAATIKRTDPDSRGKYIRMSGLNRFQANGFTLNALVAAAYALTPRAISGEASWINSDRYDIAALTPGDVQPNLDEQMAMLRKLLADRFQLTYHRESRELPVYAITVIEGGPKLRPSTAPTGSLPYLTNTVYSEERGGVHLLLPARNANMVQFAAMMQRAVLDGMVADKTGLSGAYDFDLEWTPDESQFGGQFPRSVAPTKPSLLAAMQDQLGLRLETTTGIVQALVIDRAERPSEN